MLLALEHAGVRIAGIKQKNDLVSISFPNVLNVPVTIPLSRAKILCRANQNAHDYVTVLNVQVNANVSMPVKNARENANYECFKFSTGLCVKILEDW